jgi:PEP-CTERM motif
MKMKLAATAAVAAASLCLATGASADVTTFATFSALGADNFYFQNASAANTSADSSFFSIPTSGSTTAGTTQVDFSFINLGSAYDSAVQNVVANLTWTSSSTTAAENSFGQAIQQGIGGQFVITSTTPITLDGKTYAAGSVLLSGAFSGGTLSGTEGTTSGGFDVANGSGGTLTFTSDFLKFAPSASLGSALNFTSGTTSTGQGLSSVNYGSDALESFDMDAGGSFSSVPLPNSAVPEPASWAIMLLGMGLVGGVLRRRSGLATAA